MKGEARYGGGYTGSGGDFAAGGGGVDRGGAVGGSMRLTYEEVSRLRRDVARLVPLRHGEPAEGAVKSFISMSEIDAYTGAFSGVMIGRMRGGMVLYSLSLRRGDQ